MSNQLTELVTDHKGLSAGAAGAAAAVALAPLAAKGIGKIAGNGSSNGVVGAVGDVVKAPVRKAEEAKSSVGDKISGAVSSKVEEKVEQAGGPGGILMSALKKSLPFGGGGDERGEDGDSGVHGIGEGRRMPVQQSVDIALPVEAVYNRWTQFEEWPSFMHRVKRVTQEDRSNVSFAVKIWGRTREFSAEIVTQRPDDCVKWHVTEGITHTGVVFFRELAPGLTRVELSFDVEPGGLIEKFARGARHIKRAARGDLHRFKAYVEMQEEETGAWRGTIEDGKVKRRTQSSGSGGQSSRRRRSGSSSGGSGSSASDGSGSRGRSRTRRDH
jgi:uncharacterized membrane protein